MKSILEHLSELKEPNKTLAISQTPLRAQTHQVKTFREALVKAFQWDKTPQGYNYWNNIYYKTYHHRISKK